jgi:hypothetical protein|tara:strand:+ start:1232 stop:2005 length:774 start_codon:yes stop_codon:yes gene_type:complete
MFGTELMKKKFNIFSNSKPNALVDKSYQYFFGHFDNPLNLLNNLERIILKNWKLKDRDYVYSKKFGHFINLHVKARFKTKNLNNLKNRILEIDNYLLNEIKESSLILLSFDTNEVWIDKFSKKAWYAFYGNLFTQKCFNNQAKLEILNYENTKITIKKIIKILSKVGKKKKFILMVSPHRLLITYSNKDVQIADLYCKSTYLSTYSDLECSHISYFPAFEILNNLNEREIFRRDDYIHVTHKTIKNYLMPYFEKLYF